MEKIEIILKEIRPEFEFDNIEDFFEEGMLDSFDLVTLVATLDKTFGISIKGTDILPENFCNTEAIVTLLKKYEVQV
ncbi:MAG: acyl carrier protein [Cloacibacillus sp.]